MPRAPVGIYVVGDAVVRFGRRDREPRDGETFVAVTAPTQRALLATEDLRNLRYDGSAVVRRSSAKIEGREKAERVAAARARVDEDPVLRAVIAEAGLDPTSVKARIT